MEINNCGASGTGETSQNQQHINRETSDIYQKIQPKAQQKSSQQHQNAVGSHRKSNLHGIVTSSNKGKHMRPTLKGVIASLQPKNSQHEAEVGAAAESSSAKSQTSELPVSVQLACFPQVVIPAIDISQGTIRGLHERAISESIHQSPQSHSATAATSTICEPVSPVGHVCMPWHFTGKSDKYPIASRPVERVVTFSDTTEIRHETKYTRSSTTHWKKSNSNHNKRLKLDERVLRSTPCPTAKSSWATSNVRKNPVLARKERRLGKVHFPPAPSHAIARASTAISNGNTSGVRDQQIGRTTCDISGTRSHTPPGGVTSATVSHTPPATVTLQHACRFYRCQSVKHPNAVLGMIRTCRKCLGNYTIACDNVTNGICVIDLSDVECPKCWNSNACYCGQPFSDRYIGGREIN